MKQVSVSCSVLLSLSSGCYCHNNNLVFSTSGPFLDRPQFSRGHWGDFHLICGLFILHQVRMDQTQNGEIFATVHTACTGFLDYSHSQLHPVATIGPKALWYCTWLFSFPIQYVSSIVSLFDLGCRLFGHLGFLQGGWNSNPQYP